MSSVDDVDRTVGMNTHTVRFAKSTVRFISPFTQQDPDFFFPWIVFEDSPIAFVRDDHVIAGIDSQVLGRS